MDNYLKLLQESWKRQPESLINKKQGVMVACSAGVDSTVLTHLLWEFTKGKKNFSLAICHVNFGLRQKDSDLDEAFVRDLGKSLQLDVELLKIEPEEFSRRKTNNIQMWARETRYEFFQRLINKGWIIALAHHEDDLAENVIIRIARGSSPGSLAGMSEWNQSYWRPFLSVGKQKIKSWATELDISYREDSSNAKLDYTRNVVRHKIIPQIQELFKNSTHRIARCAKEAEDLARYARLQHLSPQEDNHTLARAIFNDIPKGVAFELIAALIGRLDHGSLDSKTIHLIYSNITDQNLNKWSLMLPGGQSRFHIDQKSCFTAKIDPGPKSALQKHLRSINMIDYTFKLGSLCSVDVALNPELPGVSNHILKISNPSKEAKWLRVYRPKNNETMRFHGSNKVWSYKDLVKFAKIEVNFNFDGCALALIEDSCGKNKPRLLGLIKNNFLITVDQEGVIKKEENCLKCKICNE